MDHASNLCSHIPTTSNIFHKARYGYEEKHRTKLQNPTRNVTKHNHSLYNPSHAVIRQSFDPNSQENNEKRKGYSCDGENGNRDVLVHHRHCYSSFSRKEKTNDKQEDEDFTKLFRPVEHILALASVHSTRSLGHFHGRWHARVLLQRGSR
uniref:Uncharacterized protein n=1 Tax=Brassica campestris TaxID=3711 RepID=A0A3P6AJF9_BRACM|nr:unnamed protein product [Brassica rapa]